jgi:hypothetical protein
MKDFIENIKARIHSKPFDIYKEEIDPKRKKDGNSGYYIYGRTIYYGNPFLVFFKSRQKLWKS